MLDAAIQESLQSARRDRDARHAVGSSSGPGTSSNPAAALRAAAAERRLARVNQDFDVNDNIYPDEPEAQTSSDEEPLSKKKGKGKGKSATVQDTTSIKFMSFSERRAIKREERKLKADDKKATRNEEKDMVRKLGRKLTYVRSKIIFVASNLTLIAGRKIHHRPPQVSRGTQGCLGRRRKEYGHSRASEGRAASEPQGHSAPFSTGKPVLDERTGAGHMAWWDVGGNMFSPLLFLQVSDFSAQDEMGYA